MRRKNSLSSKFSIFVISVVIPFLLTNILFIFANRRLEKNYDYMLNKNMYITNISKDISDSFFFIDKYKNTKAQDDLNEYVASYNKTIGTLNDLKRYSDLDTQYIIRDLENTLINYNDLANDLIKQLIYKDEDTRIDAKLDKLKEVVSYCDIYIDKLNEQTLIYNTKTYKVVAKKNLIIYTYLIIFVAVSIISYSFYTLNFLKNIDKSLDMLVKNSQKVARGNFDIKNTEDSGIFEIDVLSNGFNLMVDDINRLILSIKEKAKIQKNLKEEQVKNLSIENMLKETQLEVLKSQINPHFLFNTLNTISRVAYIENAKHTETLINSVSSILRYSLKMMEENTSLKEEVDIICKYALIQETRFHDRIHFEIDVNEDVYNVLLPAMTLQPIVENAFIHGIESKEEGGYIKVIAFKDRGKCIIKVEDDGVGMDETTLLNIKNNIFVENHKGHTTGIGLINVIKRVQHLYGVLDVFDIESISNIGTKVVITVPLGGKNYD
ncbi:MAG: sensor histidine kinase [Clostridiaceae bacterium]